MRKRRSLAVICMLLIISLFGSGCVPLVVAGAGIGAVVYRKGLSVRTYNYPMDEMVAASQKAFKEVGIPIPTEINASELESSLSGTLGSGDRVFLKLISKGDRITEVSIRIGFSGDEVKSQRIHEKILKNL